MNFKVVIPASNANNLIHCVQALMKNEPNLPRDHIIVVDDGASREAEAQLPGITWVTSVKPFIFARNVNLGIRQAGTDVMLVGEDAQLTTPLGFTHLMWQLVHQPQLGVCSAAIDGFVGNPRQKAGLSKLWRDEEDTLAFICVGIPWAVYQSVGPLDERFDGYGFEDNDYCMRIKHAGYKLSIWGGCVVEHAMLPSTFRTRADIQSQFEHNRRLYDEKWRQPESSGSAPGAEAITGVDLLYLAWNRLEFTQETFAMLLANTDWARVHELFVYDDGSEDGTREWLEQQIERVPAPHRFVKTNFHSPVTAMVHFIDAARAPILAKTDNDAMLPPGWLRQSLSVMERHPELTMLGIEAMYPVEGGDEVERTYAPAEFISGLGLYRRAAFAGSKPTAFRRYFGLGEWQIQQGDRIKIGWITPAMPIFLLDRMPLEPWWSYSEQYERRGWQRSWSHYDPTWTIWRWRWPADEPTEPSTPADVDPLRRLNISHLAAPLADHINVSILPDQTAACVDLRKRWPWADNAFEHVVAREVFEHLPDKVKTMNEAWRVLRPGGTIEIGVPTTDGPGAWQDPTHVSFWNRRSFLYYEAGNHYRERFARSYGITAAYRVLKEEIFGTVDGPMLYIVLQAVKPEGQNASVRRQPQFLGVLRVRNEAAYIDEALTRVLALCDCVYVFDDHSTDDTVAICRSFGERVTVFCSPFTGLDEARDKNYLLERVIAANPDWVLWVDGDEVLERDGPERIRQAVGRGDVACYSLRIAYLWDDPSQVRVDGIFGNMNRPSLFRLRGQPTDKLRFRATGRGGNLHCGNIPVGLVGPTQTLDVRLKHYGYLHREQRQTKYEWYTQIDPGNYAEDNYRHLAELPDARFAPGPPQLTPWME